VAAERNAVLRQDEYGFLLASAAVITIVAQATDPGSLADLLILTPALVTYVLQGRLTRQPPEVVAVLVVGPLTIVVGSDGVLEPMMFLSVMLILYLSANLESTVRAAIITVVAAAGPWFAGEVLAPDEGIGWYVWTMAHVFTFLSGRLLYRQRILIDELDRARQALAEQAVAEERRRMARELHDVAGHTLAAVMLHVTGARHVLDRDPAEAERALTDAETVGRSGLDQIRAAVAALRTDERGTDPALATSADIPALVADYERAGLEVAVSIDPALAELAGGPVGTALHRIVQEALVNVTRHAPGNAVEVRAEVADGDVHVSVTDRGRRADPNPDPAGGHFGLLGMGERARALGGSFHAGATSDGWRVTATIPVQPQREPASP
jgi:signal transduction histidine kinase